MMTANNPSSREASAGAPDTPADDLSIPPFLQRASPGQLFPRPPPIEPVPTIEIEPTLDDVLKTIERLTKKQADIERMKNQLKKEFVDRLWQL